MTEHEAHKIIGDQVKEYLSALGRKGGSVKGGRKALASKANMEKAREELKVKRDNNKEGGS